MVPVQKGRMTYLSNWAKRPDSTSAFSWRNSSLEIMSAKYGWLHMSDSIEFSYFFRFRSKWNGLPLAAETNIFLTKHILSLLRTR